jgi:hypothetical protein
MYDYFSYIVGHLVDFVRYISHGGILLFRNAVLLTVIIAFLYTIFRAFWYGWQHLRHLLGRGSPEQSASKEKPEDPRE